MKTRIPKHFLAAVLVSLAPCATVLAQGAPQDSTKESFNRALKDEGKWYFS